MKTSKENSSHSSPAADLFQTLVEIVAKLRGPDGCPWDKEQTQKSLTRYVLEEAFELTEAIESENQEEIKDELGDYLFQVILQSQVAKDHGHFGLEAVIENLNQKMIRRHPHVFADGDAKTSEEVWRHWDQIKNTEKEKKSQQKQLFSYPRTMPALQASRKIGEKTEGYKFDWSTPEQVFAKVQEEVLETQEALRQQETKALEHEIGDLLFSTAQLARHLQLDPEHCLREANRRFERRFNAVLELAAKKYGGTFSEKENFSTLSLEQKEELWKEIKKTQV